MKVFAISDLHLSSAVEKPMNIFGTSWDNHFEKICEDWNSKVSDGDIVLLGGDMSWAMTVDEAKPDYALVSELKGKKIVVKGNHDLYWNSLIKMQRAFPEFLFLQNNAFRFADETIKMDRTDTDACATPETETGAGVCESGADARGVVIAGTRGWNIPSKDSDEADLKIFKRELIRLELSLKQAEKLKKEGDVLIAMLHYPPFEANFADTEVTALLEKYSVDFVLYGHLHGKNTRIKPALVKNGITYYLTSCDLIDCKLVDVCEL